VKHLKPFTLASEGMVVRIGNTDTEPSLQDNPQPVKCPRHDALWHCTRQPSNGQRFPRHFESTEHGISFDHRLPRLIERGMLGVTP
jgi:hypothetical protein